MRQLETLGRLEAPGELQVEDGRGGTGVGWVPTRTGACSYKEAWQLRPTGSDHSKRPKPTRVVLGPTTERTAVSGGNSLFCLMLSYTEVRSGAAMAAGASERRPAGVQG